MNSNSGTNLGDEEINFADFWMPITPEKPIPAISNSISGHGNQLGGENWQQLAGFPSGYVHQISNFIRAERHLGQIDQMGTSRSLVEKNRMMNQMAAGSYHQALQTDGWDGNSFLDLLTMPNAAPIACPSTIPNTGLSMARRPFIPNFHAQESSQTPSSNSNMLNRDAFRIPYHPHYDLNSPSVETYGASIIPNSFQFTPVTPPPKKLENPQSVHINLPQEKSSNEEKEKQQNLVLSIENIPEEHNSCQLLHDIVGSSCAVISTPLEEPKTAIVSTSNDGSKDIDTVSDKVIDLNKTPQQKTPKRRKHRPKVIVEGKPKKGPKAATMNIANPQQKGTEKRMYIHKKSQQESATEHPDSIGEIVDSTEKPKEKRKNARKKDLKEPANQGAVHIGETASTIARTAAPSCKKALHFDLENVNGEEERNLVELLNKKTETSILSKGCQVAESIKITNTVCRTQSSFQMSQQNKLMLDKSNTSNFTSSINLMSHTGISTSGSKEDGTSNNCKVIEPNGQLLCQLNPQSIPEISPYSTESRGSKREYFHLERTSHGTVNPLGQDILHTDDCHLNSSMSSAVCAESQKKRKIENGMMPSVTAVNHSRGRTGSNDLNSSASASKRNREILNSYLESNYIQKRDNNGSIRFPVDWYTHSMASEQDLSKQRMLCRHPSCVERAGETSMSTMVEKLASINTFVTHNMFPPPPRTDSQPGDQLQPTSCNINMLMNQAMIPIQSQSGPSTTGKMLQPKMGILKDQQSPRKRIDRQAKNNSPVTIEDIMYQMERFNLNETNGEKQNALVLYKADGIIVPYEGSEFIKKRKPRPKVDLDPETERIWKLLMWKEGTEDIEETDKEKKQRWEEERRVFRGRVESFIARMHLVQGDRRFSKWKGSVIDSVIGVFLTQNVSDHLSSSAFMSLAARFPPKPTTETCERDGTLILVQEPDLCTINLNGKSNLYEKLLHRPYYSHSSMASYKSAEHQRHSKTSCKEKTSIIQAHSHNLDEDVLSSQDSFDSSIIQSNGVRSYSGSNSEADDPTNGCNSNKNHSTCSADLLQVESTTSFEEFYSHISGRSISSEASRHGYEQPADIENSQQWPRLERLYDSPTGSSAFNQQINYNNPLMQIPTVPSNDYQLYTTVHSGALEVESLELYREESISSWQRSTSRPNKEKDASCTSKRVVKGAESFARNTTPEYCSTRYEETPMVGPHTFLSKQLMYEQGSAQPHHGSPPHEINKPFHLESQSIARSADFADEQTNRQHVSEITKLTGKDFDDEEKINLVGNKETNWENKLVESNSNDQLDFTNKANLNKSTIKAREEKSKANKDWDNLRKQVLANGGRKERSKDAMDSLDYEAMRCANVNEISNAIKARGMNNMLAERIKEFLNRLVTDHGSIDLEWLRDIPPDKAKDYLLSIRGLGLKSVECVRLLTLHHLAFPVDTNVGRIAVRLGWVPLQPLPESLQLHLLELYPVLESIQKYLWPRLCKLDQRTLYELHYQMITFGKVFCTKNRPNCNACPMRAECRHFASAFASARLVLPEPEEKSIVTQSVPLTTERGPGIVINPMPLPPPDNSLRVEHDIVSCVPIIEEPATPEQQQSEVIQVDIEDVFDEDPDEIPMIKLNMEELSVNVQNYMQANMELQECDMSKALVALNPEAASIPTPKLKNVSQLRTEHQVYELPDSHPLLNGMDKREPDDPSPYLLAIWTPGETADSIQPPERNCMSQTEPDKLCNEVICFSCNSIREADSQIVRGTLLIPCRTAMRGSFPLNGTYFQVNEMFADHASSLKPIAVPRVWIWNLPRRMVYFGTSVSTIFKGLSTEGIQYCFWKGFVCVRGFDQKTRAPRPLMARLHFPASKLTKTKNEKK